MTDSHLNKKPYFVYILFSNSHARFYIGQTNNLNQRIKKHNSGLVKSTKPFYPWTLIGFLVKNTRNEAVVLEKKLKNLNSEDLRKFIFKYFPETKGI
jgi:putative endonuclease